MITKLTKEQEDAIIPYREYWVGRILRTEQSDNEIKENINKLYDIVGLERPKQVWIMDSMFGVQIACNLLKNIGQNIEQNIGENIRENIRENIGENIRENIRENIGRNIEQNIWQNIEQNIGQNIWQNIGQNIGQKIMENIWQNTGENIMKNIRQNIGQNIGENIRENIVENIWQNIEQNIGQNIRENIWQNIGQNIGENRLNYFGFSSSESSLLHWYIYQKFYFEQKLLLEDKHSEQLSVYIGLVIDVFSAYYSKEIVIVSRKPKVMRENNRLHSDQLPAVFFKDGHELYYLDGVNFSKELWEKVVSKKMSFSEIMKIEISDQRTVALKYNPQAIIKENAKLIHKDDRNNELYLVENSEINKLTNFPKMYFVKMLCPTGRIFVEGVEPEFAEKHPNATECQAKLCDLVLSEYMQMTLES